MSADTLTANGPAVTLAPPPANGYGAFTPTGFAVVSGASDEVAVAWIDGNASGGYNVDLSGYALDGTLKFQDNIVQPQQYLAYASPLVASDPGEGVVVTWHNDISPPFVAPTYSNGFAVVAADGTVAHQTYQIAPATAGGQPAQVYSTVDGFAVQWADTSNGGYATQFERWNAGGTQTTETGQGHFVFAYADIAFGQAEFTITDNHTLLAGQAANTLPGEPAHVVTDVAAATLADFYDAAVAWIDSGTDYVSIFNSSTNHFGPVIGLDWGGASDLHIVALPDGGFAVSWMNGGAYKGELFDSAGNGGGIISLAGDVAGLTSHGDLYTVGQDSAGHEVVQTYAINGEAGGGTGSTVYTSAQTYSAPAGVTDIHLTGSRQTVYANNAGDTIWSDNTPNTLIGGTGNDTFHLGRAGDYVGGGAGNDTYLFAEIPWAGGHITDFNAGDILNLQGLMSTTSDTGTDGFADGYLKITSDSSGDAQVWARYGNVDNASDGSGAWWLVETLNGVAASSLQHTGDVITEGSASGPTSVSTADPNYVAPSYVTSITLTGSQQHIDASATDGVTINSNNTGNTLIGGAGADLFHLGRGGDAVTGGAGADTFAYAETPWAGGTITDFTASQGDAVDVSGLLAKSGYTGSDPFADGYLKYASDSSGNAQIWSDLDHIQPGLGWWLVTTLDGVPTSSLHYSGGLIT